MLDCQTSGWFNKKWPTKTCHENIFYNKYLHGSTYSICYIPIFDNLKVWCINLFKKDVIEVFPLPGDSGRSVEELSHGVGRVACYQLRGGDIRLTVPGWCGVPLLVLTKQDVAVSLWSELISSSDQGVWPFSTQRGAQCWGAPCL